MSDFNAMGKGSSGSLAQEIQSFVSNVGSEHLGFGVLNAMPSCTNYYRGHGGWLDHVLVSRAMEEISVTSMTVTGYCAVKSCSEIEGAMPTAYLNLSDHCPVMFEILNQDLD